MLESKTEMRKRGLRSPNEGDACALCFADPSGFPHRKGFDRKLVYEGDAYV